MPKLKTIFSCQSCGYQSPKWLGKCPDCNRWNSFCEEEYLPVAAAGERSRGLSYQDDPVLLKDVKIGENRRIKTNISELDRVLGGGIVSGSVILIGGDPGIGKSTLSLQLSNELSKQGQVVLYVSGEESIEQTKLRAERLSGLSQNNGLYIVNQTDLSLIIDYIKKIKPQVVVIDSIQVIYDSGIGSSAGSISQVKESASRLTQLAKAGPVTVFIIGHVTKEGAIAGPRVLEHIVDTVLYFEGERFSAYRILRSVKNRFGSTNEIGVFEMESDGLREVANPSEIFLSERPKDIPGSAVTSVLEGTRPILVEVQALVARSNFGYPVRKAQGFDFNRLNLLVAVLEKRLGLALETEDIFINVAGGIKIDDPGCDLAVALAVCSAFDSKTIMPGSAILGEVGLTGEIRSVSQAAMRINEAEKLGFKYCILPKNNCNELEYKKFDIELIPVGTVKEAMEKISSEHRA